MRQPKVVFIGELSSFTPELRDKLFSLCAPLFYKDDSDIVDIVREHSPDVFVTTGQRTEDEKGEKGGMGAMFARYPKLLSGSSKTSPSVKGRWLHFDEVEKLPEHMPGIFNCFAIQSINFHGVSEQNTMVSLFTSSYKSGDYIMRPFNTLLKQTYQNWEWVILDDSNGEENWNNLKKLKALDHRIRIYRSDGNNGIIGATKNIASSLTRGAYIIELDHDDELHCEALELVKRSFDEFPDAGFCYSDFAEVMETGLENFHYGENFSLGYGSYYKGWCRLHLKWRSICVCPNINPITIRYLVSCPNHLRAWRKTAFDAMGGWNPRFHVADDFEILLRTFCNTRMVKIPYFCYIQYRNAGGNNFTFIRNAEIQKLVKVLKCYYEPKVHERLVQMGEFDHSTDGYDWEKHGQAWHHNRYEKWLSYTVHKNDDHRDNLLSVIITTSPDECDFDDFEHIKSKIKNALSQTHEPKEVIVIRSRALKRYEPDRDPRPDHIKQHERERMQEFEAIFDEFKGEMRIKFWDLEEGDRTMCMTYASKMIALGTYLMYWDRDDRPTDFAAEMINHLRVGCDTVGRVVHKDFFKARGYYGDFTKITE